MIPSLSISPILFDQMSQSSPKKRGNADEEHTDVKKKRTKHDRTPYITDEEKQIVQRLECELTPRSTTKLPRRLGREEDKVNEWQRVRRSTKNVLYNFFRRNFW